MSENGESLSVNSELRVENTGSNILAIENLRNASGATIFSKIQEMDVTNFWVAERELVYSVLDDVAMDPTTHDKSLLHFSAQTLKWISGGSFKKYPYNDPESETEINEEVHARITKSIDIFQTIAYNQDISKQEVAHLGLSLGCELQSALDTYEKSLDPGNDDVFSKGVASMRGITAVCSLSCLDAIKDKFPSSAEDILGDRSLVGAYIDQLSYFSAKDGASPLLDIYRKNIFTELIMAINSEDETATEDALWLFNNANDRTTKKSALSKAVELTKAHKDAVSIPEGGWLRKVMTSFVDLEGDEEKLINSLELLKNNLEDNFTYILIEQPEHIEDLVGGLYDRSTQRKIWLELGEKVIEICKNLDRSSIDGMHEMSTIQAAFKSVVPSKKIAQHVNQEVNTWFSLNPDQDS